MVGACCSHGVPGRGLFIGCASAENFYYYDLLLLEFFTQPGVLESLGSFELDTNYR
jgi:hypothetical protein